MVCRRTAKAKNIIPKFLAERKLKARAYDAYPRGRVVFLLEKKKYIIYGYRCISKSEFGLIANKQFELEEVVEKGFEIGIEFDLHDKCARCNPHFVD